MAKEITRLRRGGFSARSREVVAAAAFVIKRRFQFPYLHFPLAILIFMFPARARAQAESGGEGFIRVPRGLAARIFLPARCVPRDVAQGAAASSSAVLHSGRPEECRDSRARARDRVHM